MSGLTTDYDFHNRTLIDRDGEKIGTVDEVYTDREGGQPEWALVHYGVTYSAAGSTTAAGETGTGGGAGAGTARGATGRDTSGPTTDEAMTRSEEELRVGTQRRERGRVRLRKYVVTEEVTKTVPVQREEVRLEREPITDTNVDRATSGPEISEEEHEVVLHEEEPVVEKRTVPKERVRLDTETVADEAEVTEEVRKERIETDDPDRGR